MKKYRILLSMLALIMLITTSVKDTFTVTGKITDQKSGLALAGVSVQLDRMHTGTITDRDGRYILRVTEGQGLLSFTFVGYERREIEIRNRHQIDVQLSPQSIALHDMAAVGYQSKQKGTLSSSMTFMQQPRAVYSGGDHQVDWNTEAYDALTENRFRSPVNHPFSTFSIDVDAASYANIRRFINYGQVPPKEAVRIEEMINYFQYHYPQPIGDDPVGIHTEVAGCPWNTDHKLVMIGLQGKNVPVNDLPAANLVFLIDVSGSMWAPNKLPLVKSAMKLLVDQLRPQDHVAIVVYAGAAGLVLPSTPGNEKTRIKDVIEKLQAGGATAGGAGIQLAYQTAKENFISHGNNRLILATDGDFNVGISSNGAMEELIEKERNGGVYLTVLGFGMGNYKDSKMQILADKGNGNHAYIDNINEAKKVFIHEFGGTLFTIAKDVKLQIEFNPRMVEGYRLIGYENRMLHEEDFNNDIKDAGDMGSGQSVTALYEIIPAGVESDFMESVDKPKYQRTDIQQSSDHAELMTIKLRYKRSEDKDSRLMVQNISKRGMSWEKASDNFRFAASVAEFGMLLRASDFVQQSSYRQAARLAQSGLGEDREGYRHELVNLINNTALLQGKEVSQTRIPPRRKFVMSH